LLAGVGSAVVEVAEHTFTSVPVTGTVIVTVRVRLAPLARLATVGHVSTGAETVPDTMPP